MCGLFFIADLSEVGRKKFFFDFMVFTPSPSQNEVDFTHKKSLDKSIIIEKFIIKKPISKEKIYLKFAI